MTFLDSPGVNGRLAFAILAAGIGSAFQHGYNTGVVNAPQKLIESFIRDVLASRSGGEKTPEDIPKDTVTVIWSIAVSIYCVGGMVGGVIVGRVADRFGRKGGLLMNNGLVVVAAVLEGFSKIANSYEMIIAGRFFIGVNSGLNAGLAPMYLAEIAPVSLRGAVGTVYQLVLTISILVAQVLGLRPVLGSEDHWPLLLAVISIPAVFMLVTLPFCPESPKYLYINKEKVQQAQKALGWLRNRADVMGEMEDLRVEATQSDQLPKVTVKDMLINPSLRSPLLIAVVIMLAQQFSGINAAIFFSTGIFTAAGLSEWHAQLATLVMGAVNVLMTVISMFLVEYAGRKTLLVVGFGAMFLDTIFLTICLVNVDSYPWLSYLCIILVLLFVVTFAIGPGSIPWFLVSELFNQSARPTATSITVTTNWAANIFVGLCFLPLKDLMGGYVFVIFAVLQFLITVFVWFKVPETKNKTIEEISLIFR